jgi:uncharacterized membrane protein YkoI
MKLRHLTTAMLALGLVTGCVNIQTGQQCKAKTHEGKDSEKEDDDEKEEHEGKDKKAHHEKEDEDEKDSKDSKAKLQAKAKLTETQARAIAMEKVPNGTIKEGELEMENGKLQWSFDIATPDSKDITEVNIDAITGKILDISKESPSAQAKEKDDEKNEKKEKD